MKRLSIGGWLSLIFLLAIAGLGFTAKPAPAQKSNTHKTRDISYFWYSYPGDSYQDRETVAYEEWRLECIYQVEVDQNPIGGTLLEQGYLDFGTPHTEFPSTYLYAHF